VAVPTGPRALLGTGAHGEQASEAWASGNGVPDTWRQAPGAGRKPKGPRPGGSHQARPDHDPRHPVHVTIRVVGSAAGLRRKDMYLALRGATIVTAKREDFHIVHMSIQRDHIHMIVEAECKKALSNGVRGFSISAARQINKAITARGEDRRTGRVISDRFHARPLTTPRAVRNAIAYLLCNWRNHGEDRADFARHSILLAAAADVPAVDRISAAHLALAELEPLSPADLGARGPRKLKDAGRAGGPGEGAGSGSSAATDGSPAGVGRGPTRRRDAARCDGLLVPAAGSRGRRCAVRVSGGMMRAA
jgi:REP element-mobilizing transposase RayT